MRKVVRDTNRLSDKRKKGIIAAYVECENYSAVARKFGVSRTTVKKLMEADPVTAQAVLKKKEENTRDILAHMDTKRDLVCDFIDLYLKHLTDPDKLAAASLNQISTAFGTVIDKFTRAGAALQNGAENEGTGVVLLPEVKKIDN